MLNICNARRIEYEVESQARSKAQNDLGCPLLISRGLIYALMFP